MLSEKEKCQQGLLYDANNDATILNDRLNCKVMCHQLNQLSPLDIKKQAEMIGKIFHKVGNNCVITTPFWCDYGYNIEIGNDFYCNHNLIILDGAKVKIGNHVFIAPNCCISTAGHPIDHTQRNQGLEFAYPIDIEDNVWIGANVSILPGVTIGENSIIGAGSVVTKNIPKNTIAVGSPCKVIRSISEQDKNKYK